MPKVLVAPGIGDIHWVMLKMESFIDQHLNGETPEVWVWSQSARKNRAEGYVRRLPFVKWGGYFPAHKHVSTGKQVFEQGKPALLKDWQGFDYFIAFNAPLGWGESLEGLIPECEIHWNYEIRLTAEDCAFGAKVAQDHGKYVCVSFFDHGFYQEWLKHFTPARINALLDQLRRAGFTVVHTGREWDLDMMASIDSPRDLNLTGQTSIGELFGLMTFSEGFIGFAAGNGMLAQHLGVPTFMLWNMQQWHPLFTRSWVDPDSNCYHALDIKAAGVIDKIMGELKK